MSVHPQFAEDLALYALDCLDPGDRAAMEKHLAACASCRRELEQLRGDAALLALTATGPLPPARARKRLMDAIGQETLSPRSLRLRWWPLLGWGGALASIVILAVLWKQNAQLKHAVAQWQTRAQEQSSHLDQARRVAETLSATDAMRVTVLPVNYKTPPPEGKAIYSRQRNGLIFMATNLHALPPQKAYELWLIPMQGAPIPAGIFKPDAHGGAMVINPPLPAGVEAKAFAVTIEPEQGSASPTTPIMMMGSGG
ncbi:MAG TPA: anti-sigma factor [Terriglobales bacterium]